MADGLRGERCRYASPHAATRSQLMDRANENAAQALQRSRMSRISDMEARTRAMNEVADALGLNEAPLRIECYDISNTVGRRVPGRFDGGVRGCGREEKRIPPFRHTR